MKKDAQFLRARARQALDIASRISDVQAEEQLRALAAEYLSAAEKLESGESTEARALSARAVGKSND